MPTSIPISRWISNPYSKLTRLCEEAARSGGSLTTFAAVARAMDVSPGRVSQMFSASQERAGVTLRAETIGSLVGAFEADGVRCEIEWLYLEFDEFVGRVTAARPSGAGPRSTTTGDATSGEWRFTEDTVLPDLVELRLHPPRAGNEVPDSVYVDATLLFGTALCDFEPEDGAPSRSVAIALSNARLAIGSESHAPLKGSMIGERVTSEHFARVAGGIEITGPAPDGTLNGDPIGDEYLAVVVGTDSGDAPFAVTVAANRRSFIVADPEAPPERPGTNTPGNARDAILNALIYRDLRKDAAGRAVLARATMRRGTRDSDEAP